MKFIYKLLLLPLLALCVMLSSCGKDFLELKPRGTTLETNFYQTQEELFEALVAAYDVLQWGGTNGWTMKLGLLNAASDDCFAGGSDASDQPNWVAYDNFTLAPFMGPQLGLWQKGYAGIYRANLLLEKLETVEDLDPEFKARSAAEAKFLRAFYYFDLVRFFGNIPLFTEVLSADAIYTQTQVTPEEVYAQIEQDLTEAYNTFELPETVPPEELGRITKGAVTALLGKVILYQNDDSKMEAAAALFDEVINSGLYALQADFGDIFRVENEFGQESIFEINYSGNQRGGWGNFGNGTEGNYDVQFFGMRDYVGPTYANGWSFCPVTPKLVDAMRNDPRYPHTIIDGNALKDLGASYTEGYQNTDFFIRKYAGLQQDRALDGEPALNWSYNVREIRLADVILMAAEAYTRAGNDAQGKAYLNQVRARVFLRPITAASGDELLNLIYRERQYELATEGHRFFDLVRTGRAAEELGDQGFTAGKNEVLPIPQSEIDITTGILVQNPGY
ncbi:MAG: RagB/SusD family nutrient uptake outer membrane protein [Bacteroidota bacterium]